MRHDKERPHIKAYFYTYNTNKEREDLTSSLVRKGDDVNKIRIKMILVFSIRTLELQSNRKMLLKISVKITSNFLFYCQSKIQSSSK